MLGRGALSILLLPVPQRPMITRLNSFSPNPREVGLYTYGAERVRREMEGGERERERERERKAAFLGLKERPGAAREGEQTDGQRRVHQSPCPFCFRFIS